MLNIEVEQIVGVLRVEGKISAIKKARELFNLPLVTAKCFVEILEIIDGRVSCPHCNTVIDPNTVKIPKTIQVRRDIR